MKSKRHQAIIEAVRTENVQTQERLRELLRERGFDATQATISRDIREIGLVKRDKYYPPEENTVNVPPLLADSIISVDWAGNTVVFKCRAGMAMAACAIFDGIGFDGVVGTLAGDDTIFILMRSEKKAEAFSESIKKAVAENAGRRE